MAFVVRDEVPSFQFELLAQILNGLHGCAPLGPRTIQVTAARSGPFASSYRMMIASAKMHRDQNG